MYRCDTCQIMIVDDQASICYALRRFLEPEGFEVRTAESASEAFGQIQNSPPDAVVMDIRMPGMDGLEALQHIKSNWPTVQVILMTAFSSTNLAITAMKQGAFDFLIKPFDNSRLLKLIEEACHSGRMLANVSCLPPHSADSTASDRIIGSSLIMLEVFKQIGKVAPSETAVLIVGETGVGKELVARAIYQHSRRHRKPFLAVNCAAIPDALIESELFGHEKGAFTGAVAQRPGKFEQCQGGTLFLDEIGDLSLALQGKLLRVLQDGCFQRVGGAEMLQANVRLITATHRNLAQMIRQQTFREDLFYRINVVTIELPPLRERTEDIDELAAYFIRKHSSRLGKQIESIVVGAIDALKRYAWPGNIRELENLIHKAVVLTSGSHLNLPLPMSAAASDMQSPRSCQESLQTFIEQIITSGIPWTLPEMVQQVESQMIARALELTGQNQSQAARLLGIARNTLRKKLDPSFR